MLLALVAAGLCTVPAVADPGEIAAKQAEVQRVLAEINSLDVSLEKAVEAYDAATSKLNGIEHLQNVNRNELRIAKANLKTEQRSIGYRLAGILTSDTDTSTLAVLLSATSFDDVINRVETVRRVSEQDVRVLGQVREFKATIAQKKRELARAHARQADLVQQAADARASVESQLAERKQLVASIKSEIEKLKAEERARQLALQRELQARLRAAELAHIQQESGAATTDQSSGSTASGDSASPGVVAAVPDFTSVVPSSSVGGQAVAIAEQYLGTPYVWGGSSPGGFDCSGLVVFVYAQLGYSLPHYTGALWNTGTPVSSDQLEPGDLVFFYGASHVGIYVGGGNFIHAPHTGDVVKISSLNDGWYSSSYDGARRIL